MKNNSLLILALLIFTAPSILAMESPFKKVKSARMKWRYAIGAPVSEFRYLPEKIAIIKDDSEAITDETLLEYNPEWQYVQEYDQSTKNNFLMTVLRFSKKNICTQKWWITRTLIALLVQLGADPNAHRQVRIRTYDSALMRARCKKDHTLTKYLVEKGANLFMDQ